MRLVTNAIIAMLEAASLVVGDGATPEAGAGWSGTAQAPGSTYIGYVVVHSMNGGTTDGPMDSPDADMTPLYQLSCYGATREQCELIADAAHAVMTANAFTIAGRKVMRVIVDQLFGAMRIDEVQPSEYQSAGRYRLMTTPG